MLQRHDRRITVGESIGNGGNHLSCFGHIIAEKLDAAGFFEGKFRIKNEPGRGDDPVTPFFLESGQAVEIFVGDILSQAFFSDILPGQCNGLDFLTGFIGHLKHHRVSKQNFSSRMILAGYGADTPVGHDDPVGKHIVQGGAEQDCGFSSGVFSQVSADGAGPGGCGVCGKDESLFMGCIFGILSDDPGLNLHGITGAVSHLSQWGDVADTVEFFRVDHDTIPGQRGGSAGQSGASAPGNDLQPQFMDCSYEGRHLGLTVGTQHRFGKKNAASLWHPWHGPSA